MNRAYADWPPFVVTVDGVEIPDVQGWSLGEGWVVARDPRGRGGRLLPGLRAEACGWQMVDVRYYGEVKVYAEGDTERTHPLSHEEITEMRP